MWNELIDLSSGAFIANEPPALFGIIPLYGLIISIGFLFSILWAYNEWNKNEYRNWDFVFFVSFCSIFALYGAKIWYLILDPINAFSGINDFLDLIIIILIPTFGRTIIGTIIMFPIAIIIWQKFWGLEYKITNLMDIALPSILLGQMIGRWGNFVNHQVYGEIISESSLSWLPNWIKQNMFIINFDDNTLGYRSPLFLYESMADAFIFVMIFIIFKTNNYWKDGLASLAYLISYSLLRIIIEFFRDDAFKMKWGSVSSVIIVCFVLFILSLVFFLWLYLKNENVKE